MYRRFRLIGPLRRRAGPWRGQGTRLKLVLRAVIFSWRRWSFFGLFLWLRTAGQAYLRYAQRIHGVPCLGVVDGSTPSTQLQREDSTVFIHVHSRISVGFFPMRFPNPLHPRPPRRRFHWQLELPPVFSPLARLHSVPQRLWHV